MAGLETARYRMLEQLNRAIRDARVVSAMARVPRERFVPADLYLAAYDDRPLGIGHGQTISQPLIVGMMTEALELDGHEKVLEVGTGSGYQAAILSLLARRVVSVERIPELARTAAARLGELGYLNVEVHEAAQDLGWPDEAPYDAIIVTAGAPAVPDSLVEQLAYGGHLVIPVGSRWEQDLLRITRGTKTNKIEDLGACRFVPLVGKDGWQG